MSSQSSTRSMLTGVEGNIAPGVVVEVINVSWPYFVNTSAGPISFITGDILVVIEIEGAKIKFILPDGRSGELDTSWETWERRVVKGSQLVAV